MTKLFVFVFCILLFVINAERTYSNLTELFESAELKSHLEEIKKEEDKLFKWTPKKFDCPPVQRNHEDPTDATKLRFSDIKVMMALGDSITAGFAMDDASTVRSIYDYRGRSGFVGADKGTPSVFNYFKKIGNPIIGGSVGKSLPYGVIRWPWQIKPHNPPTDRLSGAQSNARTHHMAAQVDYIVKEAKKDSKINYEKDWKVVNILMGANDLFDCESRAAHPEQFEISLNKTISKIYSKIPRAFVNLLELFEEGFIDTYNNGKDNFYCRNLWRVIQLAIPCMVKSDSLRAKMKKMIIDYNGRIRKLAKWWNDRRRKDFYIAVQPVNRNVRVLDRSWSSKFDCFHPSQKTNELISRTLWNSMQLPWDKKPTDIVDKIICPDENTILQ
eukprot:gene8426-251_t